MGPILKEFREKKQELIARDPKGLYAKAKAGEIKNLTGAAVQMNFYINKLKTL